MRRLRGSGQRALLMACAMALAVAFVLPASHASAFTEPIPVKISLLKWGGNPPQGKLYKIVSKPGPTQTGGLFSLPDPGTSDPVTNGGTLKVEVGLGGTRGTLTCTLAGGAIGRASVAPRGPRATSTQTRLRRLATPARPPS